MLADGMLVDPMDLERFRRFTLEETARWTPVIEKAGMMVK
jgi:hypothetical protein